MIHCYDKLFTINLNFIRCTSVRLSFENPKDPAENFPGKIYLSFLVHLLLSCQLHLSNKTQDFIYDITLADTLMDMVMRGKSVMCHHGVCSYIFILRNQR